MSASAVFGFVANKSSEPIFLYGHWAGAERHALLVNAVKKARGRWNDPAYATRICISQIIGDGWSGELDWGITAGHNSFTPPDDTVLTIVAWDEGSIHIADANDSRKVLACVEFEDLDVDLLREGCRIAHMLAPELETL